MEAPISYFMKKVLADEKLNERFFDEVLNRESDDKNTSKDTKDE